MYRLLRHVFLIIAACAPLILLVADLAQRYPPGHALIDIGPVDAGLLTLALALPVCVLHRLGVGWRSRPEDYESSN